MVQFWYVHALSFMHLMLHMLSMIQRDFTGDGLRVEKGKGPQQYWKGFWIAQPGETATSIKIYSTLSCEKWYDKGPSKEKGIIYRKEWV
jgi:hypothetical protein